jgi:hypothetical protein
VRTGSLNQVRDAHTATVLPTGQLQDAGGEVKNSSGGVTNLASAEIFTPSPARRERLLSVMAEHSDQCGSSKNRRGNRIDGSW